MAGNERTETRTLSLEIPTDNRTSPANILARAQEGRFVIQDFRPLCESLEWELSRLYFEERGSQAFKTGSDHVPFTINNDGNLSLRTARLFFTNLMEAEAAGNLKPWIYVLELGVGSGLFARFFLDAFQELCRANGTEYYDRMCYVATDQSSTMLQDIERNEIFANHPGRVRLVRIDALNPEVQLAEELGQDLADPDALQGLFQAIFTNYLLDNLPAAVVEFQGECTRQLCVRTCLARNVNLRQHTIMTAEEMARLAASKDAVDRRSLIDLYPIFGLEYEYRSVEVDDLSFGQAAVEFSQEHCATHVLHSFGALECLEKSTKLLDDDGFILINDYGQTNEQESVDGFVHQKFAGSVAIGLNFPLIRGFVEQYGLQWIEPDGEPDDIFSRLVGKRLVNRTVKCFHEHFGKVGFERIYRDGQSEAALDAFLGALQNQPYNWILLNEVAEFLIFRLNSYEAGFEMAMSGLALNSRCFADLWNTLGDALFCLQRFDESYDAFQRALEIDPKDVRARYRLADYFILTKDFGAALNSIANGLLRDKRGEYRERLLHKQAEILERMAQTEQMEMRFIASRTNRKINLPNGPRNG